MRELTEKLRTLLEKAVADHEIAGANLLILKNGEELLYTQAGFADVALGTPYSRDTISRLYSMSKPITAAAAMILVERGALDLGKNVGDILPAFRNMQVWEKDEKVPARRSILVKDLLNMTSGLSYPGMDGSGQEAARVFEEIDRNLYGDTPLTTMEIADKLGACGLAFHPGDKWMYGTSADILGAVIEKVSGMPFGEFLQKELFAPLGMTDTAFYVPAGKQHRLAEAYACVPGGMARYETNNLGIAYTMHRPPAFESGGAGLVSTIDDYAKFAAMLMKGGQGILSPYTVHLLTTGCLTDWQRESCQRSWESMMGLTYGNLMRRLVEPGAAVYHGWAGEYGWDGWLGCYFCNSPANGITILMTTQRRDAGTMEITRKLRNVLSASL